MSLNPGQSHKGDAQHTETRTAAESLSSGDAVAWSRPTTPPTRPSTVSLATTPTVSRAATTS